MNSKKQLPMLTITDKGIADINPSVFQYLDVDYNNLRIFKDMGLYGIRLDNDLRVMKNR